MTPPHTPAPAHPVEATLDAIGRLHAEHRANASRHHRVLDWLVAQLGRPGFSLGLALGVVVWIGVNSLAARVGFRAFDPPPFQGLSTFASLAALYLVVVILSTQRRDDMLARKRELLMLELAALAEQKAAKTIALIEELRRDIPDVGDRVDRQAETMGNPADPHAVVDAVSARPDGADRRR